MAECTKFKDEYSTVREIQSLECIFRASLAFGFQTSTSFVNCVILCSLMHNSIN